MSLSQPSGSKGITSASSPNSWWALVLIKERLLEDTLALAVQWRAHLVATSDTHCDEAF